MKCNSHNTDYVTTNFRNSTDAQITECWITPTQCYIVKQLKIIF